MFRKLMYTLAALSLSTTALAAEKSRVLYMGVDEGTQLIERDHPAFRRVFDHTGNFLAHENIRLFEERAGKAVGTRSFEEAVALAASAKRKQMDAVVLISLKHIRHNLGVKSKDKLVAIAKILDGRTLDVVDTLKVKSPTASVRERVCHQQCRQMIIRRHVREVLPEFKDKLANRLRKFRPMKHHVKQAEPSKITLTLKGFNAREVRHIEDRLVRLSSTRDLSSLKSSPSKPSFWLERRKNAPSVRADLSNVLHTLDLQARIIQTPRYVTLVKVQRDLALLD
ncbi:hypothetical protein [Terasakiella sp. SH-1]|uniref:hypothetical protein n=1 Tax=Terasakiella sp. SH-1 TaxID=2560057 RepID=UPI001073AF75|nr:hypothetical protein [Terasakiella sp. SH-1]